LREIEPRHHFHKLGGIGHTALKEIVAAQRGDRHGDAVDVFRTLLRGNDDIAAGRRIVGIVRLRARRIGDGECGRNDHRRRRIFQTGLCSAELHCLYPLPKMWMAVPRQSQADLGARKRSCP
jgi:hypothetical protein